MTSANQDRLRQKNLKKDSCVDFKLGRENVFTGKVDTVNEVASTNNSVGKRFESMISPKASKFSAKRWSFTHIFYFLFFELLILLYLVEFKIAYFGLIY